MSVLTIVIPISGDACEPQRGEAIKHALVASVEAARAEFGDALKTEYLQISVTETTFEAVDRFY